MARSVSRSGMRAATDHESKTLVRISAESLSDSTASYCVVNARWSLGDNSIWKRNQLLPNAAADPTAALAYLPLIPIL